ncbi:ATP-binding protein [Mucisphaera calidilacus]|uniref:Adenylate kinase n=1 Tax=Mucisphaera calidilacus TaxID=2527982 RepID=A0A518BY76_9BACT|nr:ATP-binding protein [Mucisphaera calidilacus]QDU71929.1 adenylate kinase [Mucisphaera calidilacus]
MRVVVTGQVGMDKKAYLEAVVRLAGERGETIELYNVGDRMYREAPDVRPGRILDLPLSRLHALRRSAMKDIISESSGQRNVIVNTHATFRWRHGLFSAFDFDQIRLLKPDVLVCLVDNIEVVHHRLHGEHTLDATLKDLMVWREEEIMATELAAQALGPETGFCIVARGREVETHEAMVRLVCREGMKRVYPSFPMTHVVGLPDVQEEINAFRAELAKHFITFDPGDVDEKLLLDNAVDAAKESRDFIEAVIVEGGRPTRFQVPVRQVLDIAGDIDGQIYMRDFKLIDQSDMIVSLVPELPGGMPGLSSGVERELQHAFEHGKEVYVVWKPAKNPSPFITETATRVFTSTDEALAYFESSGMFVQHNLFGV